MNSSINMYKDQATYSLSGSTGPRLHLAVGIATRGRPSVLCDTIADLVSQSRQPDSIVVSYATPADIADAPERFPHVRFVASDLGLTKQRNAILSALEHADIITFLDDDFYLHQDYLSVVEQMFLSQPHVAVATGTVLADGINGPGLTPLEAKRILAGHREASTETFITRTYNAYGCNMSLRTIPILSNGLRFDENLPLYGWYEDVDFSRQLGKYGDIVQIGKAYGVHLGVKSGRQSGVRLGYSQVANPVYLAKKKSVSWLFALASMTSRSFKNLVFSLSPEPFVDRRGRLRGNLRGWWELFSGTICPTRILNL